ncbi:Asparagine synthetase [Candidatus Filomicrobium marinum]|uniref:asparagine synthase (glutamine-hydrolyzing) n=2 Tax=Filomicrobium TaxID=119044 RepID=A0A0D6JEA9_9HYPH|nr:MULTISPECIES: N-acetylglutaminylglutamine amidotransferase [Filomicrobium]MCV0367848.1 N-acetylglutaminylglutamine amidotransferase [Filomicrobium sp.]CFX19730.1 Asparagine synthetase [Candidatus Filomicrobium marinum]CPR18553.1 Asparagine synthetase [Candidatus Filomicrobium marinum]SDO17317.1 asparagine synthase (glutamine-hydrolysing) [Filomicrobium insigne]
MCGICGEIHYSGGSADPSALARMTDVMRPRGPDASGQFVRGSVGLGHRRLKIIDLSERSAQPMIDSELGLEIAFNGCIYNYPALREELSGLGYRFFSHGDTEVILKAFHAWGPACVERFNGMFAFAIHNRETGQVILARDRFGIKPLYLSETNGRLRFASTLPALVAAGDVDTSIDRVALAHYMSFHAVVPPPRTIINGVKKLPPATVRVIEADGRSTEHRYWQPFLARHTEDAGLTAEDWTDRVLDQLRKAVSRRMVADVPVGVLLSGGVDSSVIVALLAEAGQHGLMTFSVGFEEAHGEKGDEFIYSDLIAKRFETDHHKIMVPSERLMEALPGTIAAMSEPMVSYDNVGFYLLSQEVSKHIKVVQSGQGADEVFAGYHWYPPLANSNDVAGDYARVFFDRDYARLKTHLNEDWHAPRDEALEYVATHLAQPGADTPVDRALRLDTNVMLVDDPVKRVDNMTMAWGLEARVPFLDHELVELAARIPPEHKLADGGKGVLKAAARRVVPSEVIDRKKGYFPVPALKYIDGPYLDMVRDALTSDAAKQRNLFQQNYLDQLFADPKAHITPLRGSELWQVALLEMWLQAHHL